MRQHIGLAKLTATSAMLLALVALSGCGRPNKQVAAAGAPTGDTDELSSEGEVVPCTKKECPPASMDAQSPGFASNGQLVGFIGEAVPWEFTGIDINDRSREVGILLDDVPSGADVKPESDGRQVHTTVTIDWTPSSAEKSSTQLKIIVRDLSRCLVKEEKESTCHTNKKLSKYDDEIPVSWEIVDKAALEAAAAQAQAAVGQADCEAAKQAQKQQMTSSMVMGGASILANPNAAMSVFANLGGQMILNQINKPSVPGC